jgi:tetratricopeptide (TPR) repeat protein
MRLQMLRQFLHSVLTMIVLVGAMAATPIGAEETIADSVRKYKFLGKTARDKSDHAEAIRYYSQLLRFQPNYHLAHYYTARAHLALGQQHQAKTSLLEAAALKPRHANTKLLLFQQYASESKPDTAWIYLAPLVAAHPKDAKYREYRRTVADLSRRAGKIPIAIGHYEAIAEDPLTPSALRQELLELLAVLYDDLGNPAQALAWRQKLATGGGATQVESMSKMVDLQIETKDYKGAFVTLKTLTRIDSASRYSHFARMSELGDIALDPGMRLSGLEGMARSQPKDMETVATIAQIHLNGDDLRAAGQWLQRGLTQVPTDAQLRVLNGDLLMRNKAPEDNVIAEYEVALKDPNWASVAQQRIWQIRPPETEEEKLRKTFFGQGDTKDDGSGD